MRALDYIATRIAPKFGVSAEVIAKRLRVEKILPATGLKTGTFATPSPDLANAADSYLISGETINRVRMRTKQ
jgi:hypothetical protein